MQCGLGIGSRRNEQRQRFARRDRPTAGRAQDDAQRVRAAGVDRHGVRDHRGLQPGLPVGDDLERIAAADEPALGREQLDERQERRT